MPYRAANRDASRQHAEAHAVLMLLCLQFNLNIPISVFTTKKNPDVQAQSVSSLLGMLKGPLPRDTFI